MKLKNYLISNNKSLKIDKAENFTTDIHLFNHLKKNNKIFFKSTNQRNNFSNYKKDYNLIKKKSLNYSKNILTFLKKYHKNNYSNLFWNKLLSEQLYRLTLCIYDFYIGKSWVTRNKWLCR